MADIRTVCRREFRRYIEESDMPREFKATLKTHERVPVFIDNLAKQLSGLPHHINRDDIVGAVRDLTRTFIHAVKLKMDQDRRSQLENARLKAEADKATATDRQADYLESLGADRVQIKTDEKGNTIEKQTIVLGEKEISKLEELGG